MKALVFLAITLLAACSQEAPKTMQAKQPDTPVVSVEPVEPVEPIPPPKFDFPNLRAAIDGARLLMTDIRGADVSTGAALLALWGHDHLKWAELQEVPLGKYGMVMKDPDTQRGKRLCTTGQVIEIAADASIPQKIYLGGMYGPEGNLYRFIAVGSTGEIVANSRAKFCGIVTGQQHYPNSMGGEAHAVHLVGMFDLQENK